MSYIGNARSLLIIGSNAKDDLVPEYSGQTIFQLSQEVPGGYESNITVLKQKYIQDTLVTESTSITIGPGTSGYSVNTKKLSCPAGNLATLLSTIKFSTDIYSTDLIITVDGTSPYNGSFRIVDVKYSGSSIDIEIEYAGNTSATVSLGTKVSLAIGYLGNWSVLEPEVDYVVGGSGSQLNRQLTLSEPLGAADKAYVLHKGEATYNFAPSIRSVEAEHLSENLRTFRCDRYVGTGSTKTFSLSGTENSEYSVPDAKALLVSIDGIVVDSDGKDSSGNTATGAWVLDAERTGGKQTITFHDAPQNGKQIRILHLGFSTVSRRASFSYGKPDSIPGQSSVGADELKNLSVTEAKLSSNSVSTSKIVNGSVTSEKISLTYNAALSGKLSDGANLELLKINDSDVTTLNGLSEVSVSLGGVKKVSIKTSPSGDSVEPVVTDSVSLGTSAKKFKDAAFSGKITAQTVELSGNITASNITTLRNDVDSVLTTNAVPIGTMVMYPSAEAPTGWISCRGQSLNTYLYKELHKIISNRFGGVAYQAGVTDVNTPASAAMFFTVPDMITRFPVGAIDADNTSTNIGTTDGLAVGDRSITHTHSGAPHTHTFEHTHMARAHYHSIGTTYSSGAWDTGSTISVSSTSGAHDTLLDHTHANSAPTGSVVGGITIQDSISVSGGSHGHMGATDLCTSLEHVHRSWPYLNTSAGPTGSVSGDTGVNFLGGPQWTESGTVVDQRPTGFTRSDESSLMNHNHSIPAIGINNSSHVHATNAYNASSTNKGVYTVSTGPTLTDGTNSWDAVTRFTNATNLSNHSHKISAFYTDFPYERDATNLSGTAATNTFHSDITNKRTSLRHSHTITIAPAVVSEHSHVLSLVYKNTSTSKGEHTHTTSNFSGSIGRVSTTPITNTTTLNKLGLVSGTAGAITGGNDGNLDVETSSVCKVQNGAVWETAKTSSATYTSNTGQSVSPFVVLNFIIKAKAS